MGRPDKGSLSVALPPSSEYPGIPGILGRSQDHPGMDIALPPLSEYLWIPGIQMIPGLSWDEHILIS